MVRLLEAIFGRLTPIEFLWHHSPPTLRRRFATLLSALGLALRHDGSHIYSLSSLRPGGATFWLQATEDSEFVRRKGRWLSTRVLEIYLQKSAISTYHRRLSDETRTRIDHLCRSFQTILDRAIFFKETKIPLAAALVMQGSWEFGQSTLPISFIDAALFHRAKPIRCGKQRAMRVLECTKSEFETVFMLKNTTSLFDVSPRPIWHTAAANQRCPNH